MSDIEPAEIVIVRRRNHAGEDAHHGGVWKIAFADFMTAMMAFFLVLWIVNSTSKETRSSVARYFNPVKLAETSPARKGLQDPKEADFDASADFTTKPKAEKPPEKPGKSEPVGADPSAQNEKPSPAKAPDKSQSSSGENPNQAGIANSGNGAGMALTELDALDNPISVLDEIAGRDSGPGDIASDDNGPISATSSPDQRMTYRDPFEPISPAIKLRRDIKVEGLRGAMAPHGSEPETNPSKPQSDPIPPIPAAPNINPATLQQANRVRQTLNSAIEHDVKDKSLPNIEVSADSEGVLISLTDSASFTMFSSASSLPQPATVKLLGEIGKKLADIKGAVVVRGHTDSHPFKAGSSDNWRLSSSRAQMAFYMLVRGGFDEHRIERLEGYADHRPKNIRNPSAPENRRIEILLRPEPRT